MKALLLLVLATVGMASAAFADNLMRTATLGGKCTKIVAMGVDTNLSYCANRIDNVQLPSGRIGFVFFLKMDNHAVILSFFGDAKDELHLDKDNAIQPIDRVNFTFRGSTDQLVAVGSCKFSNASKGISVPITCTAETTNGKFVGEFMSNGVAPDTTQIPMK